MKSHAQAPERCSILYSHFHGENGSENGRRHIPCHAPAVMTLTTSFTMSMLCFQYASLYSLAHTDTAS